jgi:hypothetical protein
LLNRAPTLLFPWISKSDDGIVVVRVDEETMRARSACAAFEPMTDRDQQLLQTATDRFERRLAEENGKLRVEMASGFGALRAEMAEGFGAVRAEMAEGFGAVRTEMAESLGGLRAGMIERNYELLKWALVFWATQIAAIAALLTLFK